jgi:hypothetical protein
LRLASTKPSSTAHRRTPKRLAASLTSGDVDRASLEAVDAVTAGKSASTRLVGENGFCARASRTGA